MSSRCVLRLLVCLLVSVFSLEACETGVSDPSGSLAVDLVLENGAAIDEVRWRITGGMMVPMEGTIDVSAPGATASVEVFGLPPGGGYLIELSATSSDGSVSCEGSAPFRIEVDQTMNVHVMLACMTEPDRGSVRVEAPINECAYLTKVVVSPLETSIGNAIDLSAAAADAEGEAIAYRWTGIGGTIANPSAPQTTFTCERTGRREVRITVSDDGFEHCLADWAVRITCVDGGGTGGVGGGGGAGGSGFPVGPERVTVSATGGSGGTGGGGGGVSMSGVFDPLGGDRELLAQDDIVLWGQLKDDDEFSAGLFGIPTENGDPGTGFRRAATGSHDELAFRAYRARFFNEPKDRMVAVVSEDKTETVFVRTYEWNADANGTMDAIEAQTTFSSAVDDIFAFVADFNLDGLDDMLISPDFSTGAQMVTANNVDDPSMNLKFVDVANLPGNSQFGGVSNTVVADLNGDTMLELVTLGKCEQIFLEDPASCTLEWVTVCPGPVTGTTCENAPSGWSIVVPTTNQATVEAPASQGFSIVPPNLVAGDFLNAAGDAVAILLPLVEGDLKMDGEFLLGKNANATLYMYSFDEDFAPTRFADGQLWEQELEFGGILISQLEAGPIDWSLPNEMVAFGFLGIGTPEPPLILGVAYWDTDMGELQMVTGQEPSNVLEYFGFGIGHFDVQISDCDGTGTSCPESNQNLQLAHVVLAEEVPSVQIEAYIWDLVDAGDPGCDSSEQPPQPPYCLNREAHPDVGGSFAFEADVPLGVMTGDFQGRGVLLGAPTVTRQSSNRPVLILAVPPQHGDRLRVLDFDQNIFPTGASTPMDQQGWFKGSICDALMFQDINEDTTCTFDFTIDGNTGNSQYQSTFTESMGSTSMSMTDHHYGYSWGGSSTTTVDAQGGESLGYNNASAYTNVSASVSVSRTNMTATDSINGTYQSGSKSSTFATAFDDTVVYVAVTDNIYRYPMLGQTCSPDGGGSGCTSNCCVAERTGLQYYTMSIPNQPATKKAEGKSLEWFQPPWAPGNIFTYPANCAALSAMYGATTTLDNPMTSDINEIGGGEGSFALQFMSTTTTTLMTSHGNSVQNDDSLSVTTGVGCTEKPSGEGAKVTEMGTFNYTTDTTTLNSSTTMTTGSSGATTVWSDVLNWMQSEEYIYSTQFVLTGHRSFLASPEILGISTPINLGADPVTTDVSQGYFSSAYIVSLSEATSEWWLDETKADYYKNNIDISLAFPTRLLNVAGGTQPGFGDSAVTQCMDNGSSQKLQCVRMAFVDTSFTDVWNACGEYFHMRGFFFSAAPPADVESNVSCSSASDCPYLEGCVSGSCGQCTESSQCDNTGGAAQTCIDGVCVSFVNGLPSAPGGTVDSVTAGTKVLLGVRVYNTSLKDMASSDSVRVQIYGQEWDGQVRATDASGTPLESFLVSDDTIKLDAIDGFPLDANDTCDANDAVFNWAGAFTTWDTTDFAEQEEKSYVFWVLVWGEDGDGNVLSELPDHGLCPSGAGGSGGGGAGGAGGGAGAVGASSACAPCPIDPQTNEPRCTWMTDVDLETWSNNLAIYKKAFKVYPAASSAPMTDEEVRVGGIYIDGIDIEGVRRVNDPLLVRARLRAQGGPVNTAMVAFFDKDPAIGETIDQEIAPGIAEDQRWPVSIVHRPSECGDQTIYVEAYDDKGFVTRASKDISVPCEEARVDALREVTDGVLPRDGRWTNARLVLRVTDSVVADLSASTFVLERVLWTAWGEELVRTRLGNALNGVTLTAVGGDADEVLYRGEKDGSRVEALVTRESDAVTIDLELQNAYIRSGLFCKTRSSRQLSTQLSLADGSNPRVLGVATDEWRCAGENIIQ